MLLLWWGSCSISRMRIVEPIIRVGLALVCCSRGSRGKVKTGKGSKHTPVELSGGESNLATIGTRPCIIVTVVHLWIVVTVFSPVAVVVVGLWHRCCSSPMAIVDEAIYLSPLPLSLPLFRHCDRRLVVILSSPQSYFHIVEPGVVDLVVKVVRVRCAGLALFCRCLHG